MGPRVLRRDEVRELDRKAIEEHGVPSLLLMENAGRACADEAEALLDVSGDTAPTLVLCGPGNNGGDGFVIARTLWNRGHDVELHVLGTPAKLDAASDDVCTNRALWQRSGHELRFVADERDVAMLAQGVLARAPLVVDALFGTGLASELRPLAAALVEAVNAAGRPVLAVDIPSGLDADSGAVLGAAVRADVTVTFVAEKPGLRDGAGPDLCGRIVVAEIGIPRSLLETW